MARKKLLYPNAESIRNGENVGGVRFDFVIDTAPDVIETATGYSPNYDKFEALGMSAEQALIWCNMD